jgi:hypothetical protein
MLQGNTVQANIAGTSYDDQGGGLYLWGSDVTLTDNTVQANIAGTADTYPASGGGDHFICPSLALFRSDNVAYNSWQSRRGERRRTVLGL